jgi:general secretion pathway protein D
MKTTTFALILLLTGFSLRAQMPAAHRTPVTNNAPASIPALPKLPASKSPTTPVTGAIPPVAGPTNGAAADGTESSEDTIPAGTINFQGVDVSQVLDVYARLVGRTLLHAALPSASIVLKTETSLTKQEAIEALQAVLSLNGISVVNVGDKFVKVVPSAQAHSEGAAINNATASELPDLGSYVTQIVQLKYVKPSEMVPILQPFAKLADSIQPIDSNGILVLRDNAENVKRMLQMIARVDVNTPATYISEVVPIKYAMAEDIATALNSLGSGGGSVSIGSSSSTTGNRGNGFGSNSGNRGGLNSQGFNGQSTGLGGGYTPQASSITPATPAGSFQDRLRNIIQRASNDKQDQIQIFGQTKIIADERSNSLLIFATQQDMTAITNVIAKLDVLLSQVLIESVIMEVSLGNSWNVGVSAVQQPSAINSPNFKGTGGINNGQSFFNFVTNGLVSSGTNNALASGLSYFGQIGNSDYDIALQAAASDSSITIIQKPRIQTFQAQPASFFVGSTVPYITGSTYGSAYGNSSSYSQLSVGVSMQVTPFINPDGLVVMQIDEEIDDISGYTTIDGNPVPNTAKKTLSSNVAVKDRDSIILGGLIYSSKSLNRSGVPILEDIPLLGALFSSHSSDKSRQELMVLIRPTVLKTPELAALQANDEKARLPGIAHAEAEDDKEQRKQVQAEERLEQLQAKRDAKAAAKQAAEDKKLGIMVSTNALPEVLPDAMPANGQ